MRKVAATEVWGGRRGTISVTFFFLFLSLRTVIERTPPTHARIRTSMLVGLSVCTSFFFSLPLFFICGALAVLHVFFIFISCVCWLRLFCRAIDADEKAEGFIYFPFLPSLHLLLA
ncbi:hypothetical protein TRSC58_07516 [Trypanosoma rangeli SC58]|uniref:Transmembrane protein n=1 Tax=Trypanosoma rangeli SC58 TaxID=429131 RepID=A0A061IT01_TRYRA|nr:hypothetical protein TRSC58_07516 [Trypanosoma rangeli SC58]